MPEKLKPVCHRAFFQSAPQHWGPCSKEHHDMVKANPKEWPDYETQELYVIPADQMLVPRDLLERVTKDYSGKPNWDALEPDRLAAVEELKAWLEPS